MKNAFSERFEEKYEGISKSKGIPDVTITLEKRNFNEKIINRVIKECQTPFFYHKFIIYGAESYERNYILKSIMDFVYPSTLMPIHFQQIVGLSYFLARNCLDIINKIAKQNFQIPHHLDAKSPFNVVILANFMVSEEVPLQDSSNNIEEVLQKRFEKESKTLNLNNFSDDVDLIEYFPLFNDKIFRYVINRSAGMTPKNLDLSNNYLRDISSLSILKDSVETLDLSNNEIKDVESLSELSEFPRLKHLMLTGNPLCENYNTYNYVIDVKRYCSKLETLDGVDVRVPRFEKNFFCCEDSQDLASQFLERYFTNYDRDRMSLKDLYDSRVVFSMSASVHPNQKNSGSVRLEHYGFGKSYSTCGITEVMKLFLLFPKTWHDPYPLVCDVLLFTDTRAHLVVNGIFRELNQMLFFNRSFYFRRNGQRFTITNEQLHVRNAIDYQVSWSFTFPGNIHLTSSPLPYFYQEYRQLEELFCTLTNVNLEYAQKCLLDSNYDLTKALSVFSELFYHDGVPKAAFTKQKELSNQKGKIPICNGLRERVLEKHKTVSLKALWETMETARFETNTDLTCTSYESNKFYIPSVDANVHITRVKKEEFDQFSVGIRNIKEEEQDATGISSQRQVAIGSNDQCWITSEEMKSSNEKSVENRILTTIISSRKVKKKVSFSIKSNKSEETTTSIENSAQKPSSNPPTTISNPTMPLIQLSVDEKIPEKLPEAPLKVEQAQEMFAEQQEKSAIAALEQTIEKLCKEKPVNKRQLLKALVHKRALGEQHYLRTGAFKEFNDLEKTDNYHLLCAFSIKKQRKTLKVQVNREMIKLKKYMEVWGGTIEQALYHTFDRNFNQEVMVPILNEQGIVVEVSRTAANGMYKMNRTANRTSPKLLKK